MTINVACESIVGCYTPRYRSCVSDLFFPCLPGVLIGLEWNLLSQVVRLRKKWCPLNLELAIEDFFSTTRTPAEPILAGSPLWSSYKLFLGEILAHSIFSLFILLSNLPFLSVYLKSIKPVEQVHSAFVEPLNRITISSFSKYLELHIQQLFAFLIVKRETLI